jgi:hypothetical protein
MKQTAVEWLKSKFDEFETIYNSLPAGLYEYTQQAKEMEKQQIIDFAKQCLDKALDLDIRTAYSQVEQYYNETI